MEVNDVLYFFFQHVSNMGATEARKKEKKKRHFSLSLSGKFALRYVHTTSETGFLFVFFLFFIILEIL